MPSPIPRRNHRLLFPFSSPVTATFPVLTPGRLPHHPFRGLLSVHSHYGLHVRQVPYRTLYTRGFSRFVTSTSAPVATGRNENYRTGFAPARKQRLGTAHAKFRLEGGWEQIVFNISAGDGRADTIKYFKKKGATNSSLGASYTQAEVDTLIAMMNPKEKAIFFENHLAIREAINHPSISGPFETGWGYTEFEGAGFSGKVGLPAFPGQATNSGRK